MIADRCANTDDADRSTAPPPLARQEWRCPDGTSSSFSDVSVNGDLPAEIGTEEKGFVWIAPGCGAITGKRVIRRPVTMRILFPCDGGSLGLHIPSGGQIGASLAGAAGMVEDESRYGLNWVVGNLADATYDYVPGTYRTHMFVYSRDYLRRTLSGLRMPRRMEDYLAGKGEQALSGINASELTRGIPALIQVNPYVGDLSRLFMQGQTFNLLAAVLNDLDKRCGDERSPSEKANAKVRHVCDMLRETLDNLPPLESLAAAVGLSQRQLARAFRSATGRSVIEWVTMRRLDIAARELADTDQPIKGVSHRAGYAHVQSFTSAFTKHFGVSPAEYRRSHVLRHFMGGG